MATKAGIGEAQADAAGELILLVDDDPEIRQLIGDFLGRQPDERGTTYWTSRLHQGTPGSLVIRSFMGSSEFGSVVAPMVRAYLAVHGTYPPTAGVITAAVAKLRAGASPAEIAEGFAAEEPSASLDDAAYVTEVYRHVYQRDPSYLEVSAGVEDLAGGTSRGQLASDHAETAVGSSRLVPAVNVAMVYLGMLGRAPDPSGWSYWVPKARATSTDTLVTGFQRSSEYDRRVG